MLDHLTPPPLQVHGPPLDVPEVPLDLKGLLGGGFPAPAAVPLYGHAQLLPQLEDIVLKVCQVTGVLIQHLEQVSCGKKSPSKWTLFNKQNVSDLTMEL